MARAPDLAKREEWRRRFREFDRGEWTVERFCRRVGVSPATFYQWKRKLGRGPGSLAPRGQGSGSVAPRGRGRAAAGSPLASGAVKFIPLQITSRPSLEVHLANGAKVLVPAHDPEAIRTVMEVLLSDRAEGAAC
jgi:transposase-like protein